jgi:hypothetical protein
MTQRPGKKNLAMIQEKASSRVQNWSHQFILNTMNNAKVIIGALVSHCEARKVNFSHIRSKTPVVIQIATHYRLPDLPCFTA